jgi:hypothetical protein
MPPNTPTQTSAKRAPRISVASNKRQAKGIASQGAKLRSSAVVPAVAGEATLVKALRAAIQGGILKTSARKKRAPPAAVQQECPSKFPKQSFSTQCANPGGQECGPVTRAKTLRTASLAAYEPAPSRPPASKPAAQVCRRRASTPAEATPASDQVISPALNMEPDSFSNFENPVVQLHLPRGARPARLNRKTQNASEMTKHFPFACRNTRCYRQLQAGYREVSTLDW